MSTHHRWIVAFIVLPLLAIDLSVRESTDLPRSVASSAYSAVRFIGGAVAPPIAAALWHASTASVAYFFAGASVLVATLAIVSAARLSAASTDTKRMPRRKAP